MNNIKTISHSPSSWSMCDMSQDCYKCGQPDRKEGPQWRWRPVWCSLEMHHACCVRELHVPVPCVGPRAAVFWVGCAHGWHGGLWQWRQVLFTCEKSRKIHRDTLRWRKKRPVWHWLEMHHASCAWTSRARTLHGVACGGVLSWLRMWMV